MGDENSSYSRSDYIQLIALLILANSLIWLTFYLNNGISFGLGNDNQIYTPALEALIRSSNSFFDPVIRIYEARTDLFSLPYFGIYYPFYAYYGFDTQTGLEQAFRMDLYLIIFHYCIASLMFSILLSRMKVSPVLAMAGGISYAYSLYLRDWSSWIWNFSAYAWLPLALLSVWLVVVEQKRSLGTILMAVSVGLVALSTSFSLIYVLITIAVMYLATLLHIGANRAEFKLSRDTLIFGGVVGSLISASHILPSLLRSDEYIRWHKGGFTIGGFKPPYEATIDSTIEQWGLAHTVLPFKIDNTLGTPFVGILLFFFAFFLLFTEKKWRLFSLPILITALLFVLDAMGTATPVHRVFYEIPLLGSIRYPVAGSIVTVTFLILAGIKGMDLFRSSSFQYTHTARFITVLLIVITSAVWFTAVNHRTELETIYKTGVGWYALNSAFLIILLTCILILFVNKKNTRSILVSILALSFLPINSMYTHHKLLKESDISYYTCESFLNLKDKLDAWQHQLGKDARIASWIDKSSLSGCMKQLRISDQQMESVAMTEGWNVTLPYISPRPFNEFNLFNLDDKAKRNHQKLVASNVTHILSNRSPDEIPAFLQIVDEFDEFILYKVDQSELGGDVLACVSIVGKNKALLETATGSREVLIDHEGFGPSSRFLCNQYNKQKADRILSSNRSRSGSDLTFQVETQQPALLVTTRVFNENWKISVNGNRPESIMVLDNYRITIPLEAGKSEVKLRYQPIDFTVGMLLSAAGFLILLVMISTSVLRKIRIRITQSSA